MSMETSIRKAIIMAMTTTKTPFFKELSDESLRNEYWGYRSLAYNNAAMAAYGPSARSSCANQMGRLMKNIQTIEAIARKRGISLVKAGI